MQNGYNSWSTITLTIPQDECSSKLFWAVRTHPGSVRIEMQNGYTVKQLMFFYVSNPLRETKQTGNQPTVVTHNHTPRFSPVHLNMERELCCFSAGSRSTCSSQILGTLETLKPQKDAQTIILLPSHVENPFLGFLYLLLLALSGWWVIWREISNLIRACLDTTSVPF